MPKINQATLVALPIPLPPFAEQTRIVNKVDALLALCDRLEACLADVDVCRLRALEAIVYETREHTEALEETGLLDLPPASPFTVEQALGDPLSDD